MIMIEINQQINFYKKVKKEETIRQLKNPEQDLNQNVNSKLKRANGQTRLNFLKRHWSSGQTIPKLERPFIHKLEMHTFT